MCSSKSRIHSLALLAAIASASPAFPGAITFSGEITQSVADGTGPAVNNPDLNTIQNGDNYIVTFSFPGSLSGVGNYSDSGNALVFLDTTASVSETGFNSASLSITADGALFDLSLVGCLTTGDGCGAGNELTATFSIANTDLNSPNAPAQFIGGLYPPMNLFEDDGVTDIQGTVTSFSNAPEPSAFAQIGLGALTLALLSILRRYGALSGEL